MYVVNCILKYHKLVCSETRERRLRASRNGVKRDLHRDKPPPGFGLIKKKKKETPPPLPCPPPPLFLTPPAPRGGQPSLFWRRSPHPNPPPPSTTISATRPPLDPLVTPPHCLSYILSPTQHLQDHCASWTRLILAASGIQENESHPHLHPHSRFPQELPAASLPTI